MSWLWRFGGWWNDGIVGEVVGCGVYLHGEFCRAICWHAVVVEDAVDGGTKTFKTDGAVFGVVLNIGQLGFVVEGWVDGESVGNVRCID